MSFYWSFFTTGSSIRGRVNCWPIEPGSLTITADDGSISKEINDNGDGTLGGPGGTGVVNYGWGTFGLDFSDPVPAEGTPILASYTPVEGGCNEDCDKCATHYIRLDVVPASILSISGSDEFTIQDAWRRLFEKIRRDILPIHLEILAETFEEEFILKVGHRFDMIAADVEYLDEAEDPEEPESGLKVIFDDSSW